jgi:hypothetical protein
MNVKVGFNTVYGRDKFDVLVEEIDLQVLLAEHGIDPARLNADHKDEDGNPDFITSMVKFRLLWYEAEYISRSAEAMALSRHEDASERDRAPMVKQAAEQREKWRTELLESIKDGTVR